jgi:hypothetical protein
MIFEEVDGPEKVLVACPKGQRVRVWKVPSETKPVTYYVFAVKPTKTPWSRARLLCTCASTAFQLPLILWDEKDVCKHAISLRVAIQRLAFSSLKND